MCGETQRNRPRAFVLIGAFIVASANAAGADDSSAASFLQSWANAWRTSDIDKMMAFYDSAKETTAIESLGHVRKGPSEIRKMYQSAFDEVVFDRVTLTPVVEAQHGSTAWATCRYKAQTRLKSDDSKHVLEVRGSFVMKKDKNGWKITLEHFSTIPDVPRVRRLEENGMR
jgi:ketosteroid isomerase-like protein